MKKPNFFIVGAPKCGTTSMSEYLKQHPDIFISEPKEPLFFGQDLNHSWQMKSSKEYINLFKNVKEETTIGEASVWYLYSKTAAREIKEFNPQSKIIVMLRNPVEMVYSLHSQYLYSGNETLTKFEKALQVQQQRKNNRMIPKSAHFPEGLLYTEVAMFAEQIQRYLNTFDRENIHVILFEDFVKNTNRVYKDTLDFLQVDSNFIPNLKIYNQSKIVRNVWIRDLLRSPVLRHCSKVILPSKFRSKLIQKAVKFNVQEKRRKKINTNTNIDLQKYFYDDIQRLSVLINRDLSNWTTII